MAEATDALETFTAAAIDWAAGGRGQPLIAAAAEALAAGLDSPTLRLLAGAPHGVADGEAIDLAPPVFEELGIAIAERQSTAAVIQGARQRAKRYFAEGGSPRALTTDLYGMYLAAGCPTELSVWTALDDWYDMVTTGVLSGSIAEVDDAAIEAAQALTEGRRGKAISLADKFVERPLRRGWLARRRRRST